MSDWMYEVLKISSSVQNYSLIGNTRYALLFRIVHVCFMGAPGRFKSAGSVRGTPIQAENWNLAMGLGMGPILDISVII